jgi:hypothetical protein
MAMIIIENLKSICPCYRRDYPLYIWPQGQGAKVAEEKEEILPQEIGMG